MTAELKPETACGLLETWRNNPKAYMDEVLGIEQIWDMQEQLLDTLPVAIKDHKHIYVGSGHSLGKDYICAAISLWFLHCYSPSIVIQTAPTDRQVKKVMWGETMAHWNNKIIDLGGTPYANPYLEIRKEDWFLIGFTTKETGASAKASGGKFQGFHAPSVCVIVSEAQAVEDNIYDQIDAVTTSENVLVIFIGNPTRASGRFAKGLRNKLDNYVFNFSCLDTPNYKQRKTVIPGVASYEWVEDKRKKWGESDPRWFGRVLGQIPETSINSVFAPKDIDLMKAKWDMLRHYGRNAGVSVDPAGEGVDDNVIMSGVNGEAITTIAKTNAAPSVLAVEALRECKRINGNFIIVDCDGVGIGTFQELMKCSDDELRGINVVKFHGSATRKEENPGQRERLVYANKRAEAAFIAQDRCRAGKASIDPNDEELIEDLMEDRYFENKRGHIQLEEKGDIKERLGRSPGRGDCFKMLQWGFDQEYERDLVEPILTGDRVGHGIPVDGYDEDDNAMGDFI